MSTTPYPTLQFGHSETTEMIRETVYQFCQSELMPIANEVDTKNEFPRHLWEKMGALGMHGITVDYRGRRRWRLRVRLSRTHHRH